MSRDWETTFATWGKPASETEETKRERTEKMITDALNADPAVSELPLKVYAKGSYANRTNVRSDSDVDINVEYHGNFYYDFMFGLKDKTPADFGYEADVDAPTPAELKNLVQGALAKAFGTGAVSRANKAIEVHERSNSIAADVVPCFTYRRLTRLDAYGNPDQSTKGTRLVSDSGVGIINWPEQHYANGVAMNKATGERFKKMVRCLKRLENEMVEKGEGKELPSYLIECLVYNVPNENFGNPRLVTDIRAVLTHIFNETLSEEQCSKWVEVNELKYLFNDDQKWTFGEAHLFAHYAWNYLGFE